LGQISLICFAAALWSWEYMIQKKYILSAIALAIATIKPQVSMFPLLWIILTFQWRILIPATLFVTLGSIPVFINLGIVESFQEWLRAVSHYKLQVDNMPGVKCVVGLESFFAGLGIMVPQIKLLSIPLFLSLLYLRNSIDLRVIMTLFFPVSITFIYGHDADLVILNVLWSWLAFTLAKERNLWAFALAGLAWLLFNIGPHSFIYFYHWRSLFVPLLCLFWIYIMHSNGSLYSKVQDEENEQTWTGKRCLST
jgi:hypothetical protein